MQINHFTLPESLTQKIHKAHSSNGINIISSCDSMTTPRELLQEHWKKECAKKKKSLFLFLMNTQSLRDVPVNLAHLNNYFKVPVEKLEHWPKDPEILDLYEKAVNR